MNADSFTTISRNGVLAHWYTIVLSQMQVKDRVGVRFIRLKPSGTEFALKVLPAKKNDLRFTGIVLRKERKNKHESA